MKKWVSIFTFLILSLTLNFNASETSTNEKNLQENIVTFIPPKGWKSASLENLPSVIKARVVGSGKGHFPPSMTLVIEPFKGTLKDYLKIVKNVNAQAKTEWKDLGKITTKAGIGSLSQFDEVSNWGITRTMTTIVVKDGNTYILSANALQEEFSDFYKDFFSSMSSLVICNQQ